jgi:protein SCO1
MKRRAASVLLAGILVASCLASPGRAADDAAPGPAPAAAGHAAAEALRAGIFTPPRQAPDFTLRGSDGTDLSLSRYRGKVVILAFGFTSCPVVCPTTLAVLAEARKELGADAEGVRVVYVTVDPSRDTAATMKDFLARFDPTFVGGTGTEDELAAVRKDYGVDAKKVPAGDSYAYVHSSYTYLVDRQGSLRALMPYGHPAADYVHDARILLRQ